MTFPMPPQHDPRPGCGRGAALQEGAPSTAQKPRVARCGLAAPSVALFELIEPSALPQLPNELPFSRR